MIKLMRVLMTAPVLCSAFLVVSCLPRDVELGRENPAQPGDVEGAETAAGAKSSAKTTKSQEAQTDTSAATRKLDKASRDPRLTRVFEDSFGRETLGDGWRSTSAAWKIQDGRLCAKGARNHPVWLAYRLPENARIEFDASSASSDGDIKAEFWGDGSSAASGTSYTNATSYLTVFGGWKNRFHVLARLDEHADNRLEVALDREASEFRNQTVAAGRSYHFKVERRDGKRLSWSVDGVEIHKLDDAAPLRGAGHEHFGFNDWDTPVCFDNLSVVPLEDTR